MLTWFEKTAPIRQKFTVLIAASGALGLINLGVAFMVVQQVAAPLTATIVAAATLCATTVVLLVAKAKVCDPYVDTVLRMEALAGGDLKSPIRYTDHADCVGRMTKAMATFRTNAVELAEANSDTSKLIVETLSKALDHLAGGDLTYRINDLPDGEHAQLGEAFNLSVQRLEQMIAVVRATAMGVNTGTDEIRAASEDLALRNEQQAASLEETAAAVASITTSVQENASTSAKARSTIAETTARAQDGAQIVAEAVSAMHQIQSSSQEINSIIAVIESISFQTNLLALNAGVEAARAGESGKGFAVVANEVRALAQRCAEAADEVKALITVSSGHVSTGVNLVGRSGEAFAAINRDVAELSGAIQSIAAAAAQAESIAQINAVVGELDRSTQQNAAMAEQCTAAASSLSQEAGSLNGSLSQFEVGHTATGALAPARMQRAA